MNKKCKICKSTENLKIFQLHGYDKIAEYNIYTSNGVYFCKDCLSVCELCDKCGKLKATFLMELFLKGWYCNSFCQCEETLDEKEKRKKREEIKYQL